MAEGGAALPWGNAGPEAAPIERDLLSNLGLQLGGRVEVLWQVEPEEGQQDTGAATTKWWGAVLDSRPEDATDGEGRQCYVLRYDPDPENGFHEQECCKVTFLEDHLLYDLAFDDELAWRREGEAWEEPAAEEGEGEGQGAEGAVYTLGEIAAAIETSERRRGRTLDQDAAEALSGLPQEQQMSIAAGFRNFSEQLSVAMARLAEQHGPGYVITEDDVRTATQGAMQDAMRGRAM